jgi:cyclic lactone autoinducer peptide
MTKTNLEKKVLIRVEKLTRKNAQSSKVYPEAPWPICPVILHQPKRPKK